MKLDEHVQDEIWTQVGEEVARKEYSPGPMAKAVAEANGDRDLVQSLYIKFRREELLRQIEQGILDDQYRTQQEEIQRDDQRRKAQQQVEQVEALGRELQRKIQQEAERQEFRRKEALRDEFEQKQRRERQSTDPKSEELISQKKQKWGETELRMNCPKCRYYGTMVTQRTQRLLFFTSSARNAVCPVCNSIVKKNIPLPDSF